MNSPTQKIAEEVAGLSALDALISTKRKEYEDEDDPQWERNMGFELQGIIKARRLVAQNLPTLAQLIEVARAAKKSHCADSAFTYQDGELIQALDFLKQTGKAEWL